MGLGDKYGEGLTEIAGVLLGVTLTDTDGVTLGVTLTDTDGVTLGDGEDVIVEQLDEGQQLYTGVGLGDGS